MRGHASASASAALSVGIDSGAGDERVGAAGPDSQRSPTEPARGSRCGRRHGQGRGGGEARPASGRRGGLAAESAALPRPRAPQREQQSERDREADEEGEAGELGAHAGVEHTTACPSELFQPGLTCRVESRARPERRQVVAQPFDGGVGQPFGFGGRGGLRVDVDDRRIRLVLDLQPVAHVREPDLLCALLASGFGEYRLHPCRDGRHRRDLVRRHAGPAGDVLDSRLAGHQTSKQIRPDLEAVEVGPRLAAVGDLGALVVDQHVRGGARRLQSSRLELGRQQTHVVHRDHGSGQPDRDAQDGDCHDRRAAAVCTSRGRHVLRKASGASCEQRVWGRRTCSRRPGAARKCCRPPGVYLPVRPIVVVILLNEARLLPSLPDSVGSAGWRP